jgi:signal transduction histidine kinase
MTPAAVPANESQRLETLQRFEILDTGAEAEFDDFTRLAARICGTPVAQITFVDKDRLWYKSNFGVDIQEVPREIGFCAHTILGADIFEVPDTSTDDRFLDNPLVTARPGVRFYAGAPLVAPDGTGIGSLCVLDVAPKALSDHQRDALEALSRQVVRQLELRIAVKRERIVNEQLSQAAAQLREVNGTLEMLVAERSAELTDAEHRLRQSQKVETIGMLASGIAHDFNNLLTVINGTAELAASRLPSHDPAQRDLEDIATVGKQAAALTRQLLTFSRSRPARPTRFDMNASVTGLQSLLSRLIGKNVSVTVQTSSVALPVLADPAQMDQVLLNLAVNARDAMPDGGRLHIETRRASSGDAELVVSDTGVGMDEATRARVFEPFFTTKEPGKGTGLGLATVQSIVQQAGGSIDVTSAPGRGTTFVVRLPHPGPDAVQ